MKIPHDNHSIHPDLNLEQARRDALALIQTRAYISAGIAVVPVPFLDVMVDVGLLSNLLPEINAKFGLSAEQMSVYDPQTKQMNWHELRNRGIEYSSLLIARTTAKGTMHSLLGKQLMKQVSKFIPFGGQIVAAGLGYLVMKKVAEAHVEECYQLAQKIQKQQRSTVVHSE